MLIRRADGSRTVINFRERAPLAARPDMYLDPSGAVRREASLQRLSGGRGARHGDGARHGAAEIWKAGPRQGHGAGDRAGARRVRPRRAGCRDHRLACRASRARQGGGAHFSAPGRHRRYQAGDRLVQPDLAATLALIAEQGPEAFYRGPIAAAVAAAAAAHGGILTKEDFADYTVAEAAPVCCVYRGYLVYSAPPPSAGGTVSVRDAASPRRLGSGDARLPHAADDLSDGRDDAPRLYRPQYRVRRPGFRARPGSAPAVARIRRRDPRRDRSATNGRPRRPGSVPAPRRTKRPRRRIIRSSISTETPSR